MVRFLALVLSVLPAMAWCDVAGTMRVIDADTFEVGGETIRLFGIDAPEKEQRCGGSGAPAWACGLWATGEVRARYQGGWARCEEIDTDRYGRIVARCWSGGQDIGRALVQDGLAFAYRKYSWDYDLDEKQAAVNGRGLHATGVQSPADFRAAVQATRAQNALSDAPEGCVIKGNISADNKRIYHSPGQIWYERTRINTAKGERWFCSAREAQAAGWRAARK